jgi:hypothetical protein
VQVQVEDYGLVGHFRISVFRQPGWLFRGRVSAFRLGAGRDIAACPNMQRLHHRSLQHFIFIDKSSLNGKL